MATPGTLTIPAFAKLNLALGVGAPIPPRGYHPIASWFVPIDLADAVMIRRLPAGETSRHAVCWHEDALAKTPIDWPIEKDLAVRAHRLLEAHVGHDLPLEIQVCKRIPVGGGLGGGSSDAASVLLGVNAVFGLGFPASTLQTLAQRLGSDVAYFVDEGRLRSGELQVPPRAALVTGFGERLERVGVVPQGVLLFFPPFGCPTGDVYRAFDAGSAGDPDERRVRSLINAAVRSGRVDSSALFNDLAAPACRVEPRLAGAIADLAGVLGPHTPVHVTGSGSTLFALVEASRAIELGLRCAAARPDVGRWVGALLPLPAP